MAEDIEVSNLVTKISIDDTGVERSMASLTRQMKVVESEFKAASARLGEHANSQDALKTKTDLLSKQMDIQAQRIAKLKKQHEESAAAKGKDAKETQNLEIKLNKAVAQYNKLDSELKKTTTELEKQTSAWNKASSAIDAAAKKMESAGQAMTKAGTGLSLMVTAPIAAAGVAAGNASIEFETAFAGVQKTVDATAEEFKKFEKEIIDMSKQLPATAVEIAGIAEAAGQLGVKNEAIMSFTRTMADLGVSTNMSSDQAATALARLANITQMPQSEFDKLGSTIVALGNNLATTEAEITEMALRLAGAGHQIGLTEAQILAFAGALSSVGIEAEAGGSSFSRVMVDMANAVATGGASLESFASVAGMSSQQFKTAFEKDAAGALVSFVEGLGRMSKAGENTFAVLEDLELSEIRVRDALLRTAGAGDLLRNSLELGTKAWEENTALTKEANTRYETTKSQLEIMGNRITATAKKLGDALVPAIMDVLDSLEPLFKSIEEGAEWFASLDTESQKTILTMVTMVAAAGPLLIIAGQLTISIAALVPVVKSLGTALAFLATNPIGLTITAILTAVGAFLAIKDAMNDAEKAAAELAQAQEELQAVQQNGITRAEVDATQERIDKGNELIETYQKLIDIASESNAAQMGNNAGAINDAADELDVKLEELAETAKGFGVTLEFIDENGKIAAKSMKDMQNAVNILNKAVKDANKETTSELNDKAKQIAIRKQEIVSIDNLIKTYTTAEKGSDDWLKANKELTNQFPQFVTATGLNTEAVKGLVLIKQQEIEKEWESIRAKATAAVQDKNAAIAKQEAAIKVAEGIAKITGESGLAQAALTRMNDELDRLRGEAASLQALANSKPEDIPVAPVKPPPIYIPSDPDKKKDKGGGTKAYENKALDEAYKKLEHLKALDQLTAEQELKSLEEIRSKYIKTADERMAIEEKIYALKKQMGDDSLQDAIDNYERAKELGKLTENDEIVLLQRIKKLYADSAEERKDMDDRIFEATQRKIEAEKQSRVNAVQYTNQQLQAAYEDRIAREKLSDEEMFKLKDKLYNEQIYLNKNYLQKVLADSRYSAAEKRQIEREITEQVRQQTNERIQLQREYTEAVNKSQIDSVNDLSKGIQGALKEKYQTEKKAAEEAVKDAQEANEKWKNNQLDAIKTVYNARVDAAQKAADAEIEHINSVYNAQIEAIQAELDALEQAEKQKSRGDMDAEDQRKIDRLQGLIEYEHDEFNKAQLQKELNKILAEQDERHRKEQLDDKKEALKEEQKELKDKLSEETKVIKDQLEAKKEIMAAEYQAQQDNINAIYNAQKAAHDQHLISVQNHYNQLLNAKALQAEAEKMIINQQQQDILKLLKDFGDDYNIAGQTLGEQMYEGFKGQVMQIQPLIDNINAQIAAARAAAVSAMNSAAAGSSNVVNNNNSKSVSQVNNFYSPASSPSAISRATQKAGQALLGY